MASGPDQPGPPWPTPARWAGSGPSWRTTAVAGTASMPRCRGSWRTGTGQHDPTTAGPPGPGAGSASVIAAVGLGLVIGVLLGLLGGAGRSWLSRPRSTALGCPWSRRSRRPCSSSASPRPRRCCPRCGRDGCSGASPACSAPLRQCPRSPVPPSTGCSTRASCWSDSPSYWSSPECGCCTSRPPLVGTAPCPTAASTGVAACPKRSDPVLSSDFSPACSASAAASSSSPPWSCSSACR